MPPSEEQLLLASVYAAHAVAVGSVVGDPPNGAVALAFTLAFAGLSITLASFYQNSLSPTA